MQPIDWGLLVNWIVAGFIGLIFGLVGGYATYKFGRLRDDVQWEREKAKMEQEWKHNIEKIEMTWQQKMQELQIQFLRQDQMRLRDEITRGLDNPTKTIQILSDAQRQIYEMNEIVIHLAMIVRDSAMSDDERKALLPLLEKWKALMPSSASAKSEQASVTNQEESENQ